MTHGEGLYVLLKEYAGYVLAGLATLYYMMVWAKRKIMDDLFATKGELSQCKTDVDRTIKDVMRQHEEKTSAKFKDLDHKLEKRHLQLVDIITRHVDR